jgi:hypothetical protein
MLAVIIRESAKADDPVVTDARYRASPPRMTGCPLARA